MSFGSLLLRLFLIMVLALNGVSTAIAATHMRAPAPPGGETAATDAAAPKHAAHGGCHGMQMQGDAGHAPAAEHTASRHSGASREHASGHHASRQDAHAGQAGADCCESGACRCDCLHAAQEALPRADDGAVAIVRTHDALLPARAHPAPALPAPVRPPIG